MRTLSNETTIPGSGSGGGTGIIGGTVPGDLNVDGDAYLQGDAAVSGTLTATTVSTTTLMASTANIVMEDLMLGGSNVLVGTDTDGLMRVTGLGISADGNTFVAPNGAVDAPSYAFSNTGAGLYSPGANIVAVTTAGTESFRVDQNGVRVTGNIHTATAEIRIGPSNASYTAMGASAVAIGAAAGLTSQSGAAIALGINAGSVNQGASAIAVGRGAGFTSQGSSATAIGNGAGSAVQGAGATAVGSLAGTTSQGASSVAIGISSGFTGQGTLAVAVGRVAGTTSQQAEAIAIGNSAGTSSQGTRAIAVGRLAGSVMQGTAAIAIGTSAGQTSQGSNAIAIGTNAGQTSQIAGSIALNASGTVLTPDLAGFYVKPVRADVAGKLVLANTTSSEIVRCDALTVSDSKVGIGTAAPSEALHVVGNITTTGTIVSMPGSSVTPMTNGQVAIEFTSNGSLTFRARGSDGQVRSATLTLS